VPAPQSVHAAAPVTILYFPATQVVHGPPLGPVDPRLQRQEPIAVCAVADVTEFAGQAVHRALPFVPLYVLKAHPVHGPPLGPEYPTLQRQLVSAIDP
jgi:hypothetical protein